MIKRLTALVLLINVLLLFSCDVFTGGTSSKASSNNDNTVNEAENPDYDSLYTTWGLGNSLLQYAHNDTDYSWYWDQIGTGAYDYENCGPTSVTMGIKWADETFLKTPEDARNTYKSSGGWWAVSDIINYLNDHSIENGIVALNSITDLVTVIESGYIAILCLDVFYLTYNSDPELHVDAFYSASSKGAGHFIVIKGYMNVDNKLWFEVYDPGSAGRTYSNGALKGINRYYSSSDLDTATNNWWDAALVIAKDSAKGTFSDSSLTMIDKDSLEDKTGW